MLVKIGFNNDDGRFYFTKEEQKESFYGNPEENGFASGVIEVSKELADEYFKLKSRMEKIENGFTDKIRAKDG